MTYFPENRALYMLLEVSLKFTAVEVNSECDSVVVWRSSNRMTLRDRATVSI